jgi:uncharacterized short protein YbdD (DUF466 family)
MEEALKAKGARFILDKNFTYNTDSYDDYIDHQYLKIPDPRSKSRSQQQRLLKLIQAN